MSRHRKIKQMSWGSDWSGEGEVRDRRVHVVTQARLCHNICRQAVDPELAELRMRRGLCLGTKFFTGQKMLKVLSSPSLLYTFTQTQTKSAFNYFLEYTKLYLVLSVFDFFFFKYPIVF